MIPLTLYLSFLAASALVLLIPGPNVALIVSASIAHGRLRNRLSGGLLIGAGVGLALARKS